MTESDRLSRVVGQRIKQLRKRRGWSVRVLAEKCRDLGADWITDNVVENVEREPGKSSRDPRDVTVDELLVFAYVLNAPPLALALPVGERDEVEIVPGVRVHPDLARQWIDGEDPLPGTDLATFKDAARALNHYQTHREIAAEVAQAKGRIGFAEFTNGTDSAEATEARKRYAAALGEFAELQRVMQADNIRPLRLHPQTVADMTALGIDTTGIEVREATDDAGR